MNRFAYLVAAGLIVLLAAFPTTVSFAGCCIGTTGNVDGDPTDMVDISDVLATVDYLVSSLPMSPCAEENDVTQDGTVDISDIQALVDYLVIAQPLPPCGGTTSTGVLLVGDPDSTAVSATVEIPEVIPEPYQILDTTGLFANRLFVVLSPLAKIGAVNAVLDSVGAKIISMSDASLFLTLSIPAITDSSQATAICQRMRTSGLFLFAFPTYSAQPPPNELETPEPAPNVVPGDPALTNMSHLKTCSMPAAWNAKEYAAQLGHKVSVLVPDTYVQLVPSSEIPSQVFVSYPGDGADSRVIGGEALGNHGFHVCGIIGANFDDTGSTGIHPGPTSILAIRSLNVGGEEWGRKMQLIKDAIPDTGTSVVSTSMGYNDPLFRTVDKWQRVLLALKWRELVGGSQTKFLHGTSAGNDARKTFGDGLYAVFNSPFTMASLMNSPSDWLGPTDYTLADITSYQAFVDYYISTKPWIFQPLSNVIVVGSSTKTGAPSTFSNWYPDVRMMGERVFGPCMENDVNCFDKFAILTGTSQATPQIAGLAAFMINLRPSVDVATLKRIIVDAYDYSVGFVNAYRAVLALDNGLNDAPIRKAILDVDQSTDTPVSGPVFDERDIKAYLGMLDPSTGLRDFSIFDLNGDGYTGGGRIAAFDLTADNPQAFANTTEAICGKQTTFDEQSLTDLAILKYYAYSNLYSGDTAIRDTLLGCYSTPGVFFTFDTDLQGWGTGTGSCCFFNQVYWTNTEFGGVAALDGSDASTLDTFPNSWMVKMISIPAGATTLRFDTSPHNRAGANGALRVRLISYFQTVASHTLLDWETLVGVEGSLVFVPRQVNIAAFAGQTVTLFFEQRDSGGGVNQQRYIDNIRIQ